MDDSSAPASTYNSLEWFLASRLRHRTDLPNMRRTAEELRDRPGLVRNALHVLLRDQAALAVVAGRSTVHGNGFAKVVLSRGNGWSLRLHVWSRSVKPVYDDLNPHGHRWAFASWIMTGTLRETTFVEDGRGQEFHRCDYGHAQHTGWKLQTNGATTLAPSEQVDREAGTVYGRIGTEVHTAIPRSDLVATLVLQGPHRRETTDVFLPPDSCKQPGEHGDEPLSVDDLRLLVAEVLAELP